MSQGIQFQSRGLGSGKRSSEDDLTLKLVCMLGAGVDSLLALCFRIDQILTEITSWLFKKPAPNTEYVVNILQYRPPAKNVY